MIINLLERHLNYELPEVSLWVRLTGPQVKCDCETFCHLLLVRSGLGVSGG